MDLIRSMLSDEDEEHISEQTSTRSDHYDWLRRVAQSMTSDELDHLVSHRGFHLIGDSPDERPLENSLDAYEAAWGSGIHLCECDSEYFFIYMLIHLMNKTYTQHPYSLQLL